ncbi:MAG: carboxypeptidase regulatory-like domain-containing protein, partial [Acidobacteria bacterium]|nr:carboxypeptidase regulatory-like domain-containing protein [Acidobacteriota bacterium]
MRRLGVLAVVACALAAMPTLSTAQTFLGGVRGSVKDAQGIIPGVTVSLLNEETGISRETASNDSGEYSFPAVSAGLYTVRAGLAGFKTFERQGIRIATQTAVTLDIVLEVGTLQETITVTADAPLIE